MDFGFTKPSTVVLRCLP